MDSNIYSRCRIIVETDDRYGESTDPLWVEFFRMNNLGIPIAKVALYELGEINEKGLGFLNETWLALCKLVMVDSDEEYEFLDDMLQIGELNE